MNSSWHELLEHTKSHQYQTSDEQTQVRDALLILDIIKWPNFKFLHLPDTVSFSMLTLLVFITVSKYKVINSMTYRLSAILSHQSENERLLLPTDNTHMGRMEPS